MTRFLGLSFLAGFLAVLCFHQPVVGLLHAYGVFPFAPFATARVPPLGVPAWFSASFWGGLWGILMLWLIDRANFRRGQYWFGLLFGGAALTLTALLIVVPLKGGAVAWAAFPERFIGGFLVNGAWGLGAVIFARTFRLAAVFSRG
jgi:hypothetical protein